MRDFYDSVIRTITPVIVGSVIGWFAAAGIEVDPGMQGALTNLIMALSISLYYLVIRLFEVYVSPRFGIFLGAQRAPVYTDTK